MTPKDARSILREKGLCGRMVADDSICILARGHDDGTHESGWRVTTRVLPDPDARDSRESITEHRVSSFSGAIMVFTTNNLAHANWLAKTLTEIDAE